MTLVAILTVRKAALERFREYESKAAEVMAAHGGRIERTVVVEPPGAPDLVKEIHVVSFPSDAAYAAYRDDPLLAPLAYLREGSIVRSEVLVGEDGPNYHAQR